MSFADTIADLEAMNDPCNTVQTVGAIYNAKYGRSHRSLMRLAWLLSFLRAKKTNQGKLQRYIPHNQARRASKS